MSPKTSAFPITPCTLPVAIRVYPEELVSPDEVAQEKPYKIAPPPKAMLVLDTETTADTAQRLTFGSYRFLVEGVCQEEALFYADDLPAKDRLPLEGYVANHKSSAADSRPLQLLSRLQFLKKFYAFAYKSRVPVVGFNLPFDISRLAFDFVDARGWYAGGFSLGIWNNGFVHNQHRPPVSILHIDSKRALIAFRSR